MPTPFVDTKRAGWWKLRSVPPLIPPQEENTDKMSIKNEETESKKYKETNTKKNDKLKEYTELLNELPEFKGVIEALYKMEPLIDKAENFITKYEKYTGTDVIK